MLCVSLACCIIYLLITLFQGLPEKDYKQSLLSLWYFNSRDKMLKPIITVTCYFVVIWTVLIWFTLRHNKLIVNCKVGVWDNCQSLFCFSVLALASRTNKSLTRLIRSLLPKVINIYPQRIMVDL